MNLVNAMTRTRIDAVNAILKAALPAGLVRVTMPALFVAGYTFRLSEKVCFQSPALDLWKSLSTFSELDAVNGYQRQTSCTTARGIFRRMITALDQLEKKGWTPQSKKKIRVYSGEDGTIRVVDASLGTGSDHNEWGSGVKTEHGTGDAAGSMEQ
ncbi:hypothetical protein C8R44DRAFT_736981 [Mycena epipterygia]|nr:hypothetical protein C8R44DRAFT_736981 [Mycena epipterygia]